MTRTVFGVAGRRRRRKHRRRESAHRRRKRRWRRYHAGETRTHFHRRRRGHPCHRFRFRYGHDMGVATSTLYRWLNKLNGLNCWMNFVYDYMKGFWCVSFLIGPGTAETNEMINFLIVYLLYVCMCMCVLVNFEKRPRFWFTRRRPNLYNIGYIGCSSGAMN